MTKALILIDYINEICHPDGKISSCAAIIAQENIISKVNQLTKTARDQQIQVIWVTVAFDQNYYEANLSSPIFSKAKQFKALQRNSWGAQLLTELEYLSNELIIVKNAVNPFHSTNLDHVLRAQNINELFIAGVSTDVAIQSCTRDAHDRGYKVNVIGDCCASGNIELHKSSLEMLSYFGKVISSNEFNAMS